MEAPQKKNPAGVRGCRINGYRGGDIRDSYLPERELGEPWSSRDDALHASHSVMFDTISVSNAGGY